MHAPAVAAAALLISCSSVLPAQTLLYVSPQGNDAWSGGLEAPNAAGTDGPLATLAGAKVAVRAAKAQGAVTVMLREGEYFVSETLSLGPEDCGTKEAPVTYAAYPDEKPRILGGESIETLTPGPDGTLVADLPKVREGKWRFSTLLIDGKRAIRARHPNFDPSDPYRKGFSYAQTPAGSFAYSVGNIHNVGDWLEYDLDVPADGQYHVWVLYGALNKPHGRENMAGRTAVRADDGELIPLMDLPDTGSWAAETWSDTARLQLVSGKRVLHWENLKGGGLNLAAFALTDDPEWKPVDTDLPPVAEGKHLVVVSAAKFARKHGPQVSVSSVPTGSKDTFSYEQGDIRPHWAQVPGAEVHIFQSGNCRAFMEVGSIEAVDEGERLVRLGGPEMNSALGAGDRYFVENVPDALDAPGEWYLDVEAGQLRLIPPEGYSPQSQVVAATVGRIIEVVGDEESGRPAGYVRFEGLTFIGGDYDREDGVIGYGMGENGVLYLQDATGCEVAQCTFVSVGKHAVCCSGGGGHVIGQNDISHTAYGGVMLLNAAGCEVFANHIHHSGEVYKHNAGIAIQGAAASNNTVRGNAIHDMSRYAISIKNGGKSNVIEDNWVCNTSLETFDTGAIEVTQQDREGRSGSIIRRNYVADTIGWYAQGDKSVFMSWSIYLDSFAGGYTVTDNICPRSASGGIMLQGGKDNAVTNNVLIDGRSGQGHWSNFIGNSEGLVFEHNIVAWSNPEATLWATGKLGPEVIRADNNLYWCPGIPEPRLGYGGNTSWAAWQAQGFDQDSLFADPLFADPAADDYTLAVDSPAWKLGFRKIDTSGMEAARRLCTCEVLPAARLFFED